MGRVSLNTWRWQQPRRDRPGLARVPPAARRDLDAGVDELRGLVARGDRDVGLPVRRRRRRDPAPAHRAHPRRLARRGPRRTRRAALRLPRRRAVGPGDGRGSTRPAAARPYARASRRVLGPTPYDAARSASAAATPPHAASVVVHDEFDWERRPAACGTRWRDTVIYELHVKGYTQLHNEVPEHLRGTYAGLGSPTVTRYLHDLGVTAVELLPVHHFLTEPAVAERGPGQLLGLQLDRLLRPARGLLLGRRPRPAGHRVQADGEELPRGRHRGDPRRRLQPHRRGRARRSDVLLPRARRPRLLQAREDGKDGPPTGTSPAAATPSTPPTSARCG